MQIENICNSRAIYAWVVSMWACCCQNRILIGCIAEEVWLYPMRHERHWSAIIIGHAGNAMQRWVVQRNETMQCQYPANIARQLGLVWITWLSWPTHRINIATSCFETSCSSITSSQFLLQARVMCSASDDAGKIQLVSALHSTRPAHSWYYVSLP